MADTKSTSPDAELSGPVPLPEKVADLATARGLRAVADADASYAARYMTADGEAPKTLAGQIEHQRNEIFGAMAVIDMCRQAAGSDENHNLWRALGDCYKRLDVVGAELDDLATRAVKLEKGRRNA